MPPTTINPYWQTTDKKTLRLYLGDVLAVLRRFPSASVQMVVTSPPYWGLRDYGTGEWEGGSKNCDHIEVTASDVHKSSTLGPRGDGMTVTNAAYKSRIRQFVGSCKKCGAKRIDQQIGSEPTPQEFVEKLVAVFREVRRVLRNDGTLWLNLGSSYFSGKVGDETETLLLREDLSPDELQYVLSELATHFNKGGEVTEPD